MQLLPINIRIYNLDIEPAHLVRKIRANTINERNALGYIRKYNPNNLIVRNEKEKGIYLKEQGDLRTRYGGGTTAIFVSDSIHGKTKITAIAYFGWQQSLILFLLLIGLFYTTFYSPKDTITVIIFLIIFLILFAITSSKALARQRNLIEKLIENYVSGDCGTN